MVSCINLHSTTMAFRDGTLSKMLLLHIEVVLILVAVWDLFGSFVIQERISTIHMDQEFFCSLFPCTFDQCTSTIFNSSTGTVLGSIFLITFCC